MKAMGTKDGEFFEGVVAENQKIYCNDLVIWNENGYIEKLTNQKNVRFAGIADISKSFLDADVSKSFLDSESFLDGGSRIYFERGIIHILSSKSKRSNCGKILKINGIKIGLVLSVEIATKYIVKMLD